METQHRDRFMQSLSDYEILALAYCQMDSRQNQRMSTLLERNQSDSITPEEGDELEKLVAIYEHGSLLKAQAAAEAIRRRLIEQPTS
jgi:hypothetical protein